VYLSITTLDRELQRTMEPRTSTPERRLDAVRVLSEAGVDVGVMIAPVIPGLTDHEMPAILEAARAAGAVTAGMIPLRLPHGVKDIFADWIARAYPDRAGRVLNRVREMRGGELYDSTWHRRMRGDGVYAEHLRTLFEAASRKHGFDTARDRYELSTSAFRRPAPPPPAPGSAAAARDSGLQLGLFDE
jgi:DNA repair photolyase